MLYSFIMVFRVYNSFVKVGVGISDLFFEVMVKAYPRLLRLEDRIVRNFWHRTIVECARFASHVI